MKTSFSRAAALVGVVVIPAAAFCQNISVIVNGEPISFEGVGPQQVNGRVLVPLRGIMEKLGAYVSFDGATKTVNANKAGIDLTLHLGDRHAVVNGRDVTMDVPPQELRGSTMVPLRFVGEALGAEVRWNAATYTVNISTSDVGTVDQNQYLPVRNKPPVTSATISSFDVDHTGTFRGGDEIKLTLIGTPGGNATFSIPGVIQDVPMTETQPGVYVGTFRVPKNSPINITNSNAIARLAVNGTEKMTQASSAFGFDNQPPLITSVTPEPDSRVIRDRPSISATFDDGTGSGVDPASVEVRLDDRPVTQDAEITSTSVTYRPNAPLGRGTHEISIQGRDRAGNQMSKTWSFRVVGDSDVIRSFTYDAGGQELTPGTEVTFTLRGEAGGQASYSIGDRIINRRMTEVEPGKYVGRYTIRRNDNFTNAPVTAKLVTANGDSFTHEATSRFNADVRTLEQPTFTNPSDDSTVGDRITLRGTAAPGSRIQLKIDYNKTTLGILRTNGTIAEMEVVADDQGRWVSDPIDLRTGLGGGSTTYTVTAVAVGSNGKRSETTKLTLHS